MIDAWTAARRERVLALTRTPRSRESLSSRDLDVLVRAQQALVDRTARGLQADPVPMLTTSHTAVVAHRYGYYAGTPARWSCSRPGPPSSSPGPTGGGPGRLAPVPAQRGAARAAADGAASGAQRRGVTVPGPVAPESEARASAAFTRRRARCAPSGDEPLLGVHGWTACPWGVLPARTGVLGSGVTRHGVPEVVRVGRDA